MSNALSSVDKFSSPPSLVNYSRHKIWIDQLTTFLAEEGANDALKAKLAALEPMAIPMELQAFANQHSLRTSEEEKVLQNEALELSRAVMIGAPDEANFLCLLLEMMNAKTVVEVGVFRGVTTLAFAKCLHALNAKQSANRKVIGLDVSEEYTQTGQKHWKLAGVDHLIELRIGDAKESLSTLLQEAAYGKESVDLCFIDADKKSYDDYYEKCLQLTKPGGLIVVDNTLWGGMVALDNDILEFLATKAKDYGEDDKSDKAIMARRAMDTIAIQQLATKIHQDDRIERVSFLTIADGVTICRKK